MGRNDNFRESSSAPSLCHGAPCQKNRCTECGHRQTIGNVAPVSSRKLSMKNPLYPAIELKGRHDAKKAGRNAKSV